MVPSEVTSEMQPGWPGMQREKVSRPVGNGVRVPLSEEEQRILQEMEQTLREHDRDFVARVDHHSHRLDAAKSARWSLVGLVTGFALLLSTFRFSVMLASFGFLVMLISTLVAAQHLRNAGNAQQSSARRLRSHAISGEWSDMRRRMRSRFGHHD